MFIAIRLVCDVMLIASSYVLAYLIKFNQFPIQKTEYLFSLLNQYKEILFYIVLIYLACFYFSGMYKTRKGFLIEIDEFIMGGVSLTSSWVIVLALTFIRGEYLFARPIIILSLPLGFLLVSFVRYIVLKLEMVTRANGFGARRALVIGSGKLADSVALKIKSHPSYGIIFAGFVGKKSSDNLGELNGLEKIIDANKIDAIYIADQSLSRQKLTEIAGLCSQKNVSLGTLPDILNILTTSPNIEDIEGFPIISLKQTRLIPFNRFIKRAADIILALFSITISALPMLIIAVLIKITSPGPVIFVQKRVGTKGRIFRLYKFRTMVHKAERLTGPTLATEDDPRKTPFGQVLRASKLDELPQLFNILKGDMSFVGPRPERPIFVRKFKEIIPKYMERHDIKVGLAGWAQMHGGYDMPADEKIKYDLYYIENWSFLLDIKILLKCMEIAIFKRITH